MSSKHITILSTFFISIVFLVNTSQTDDNKTNCSKFSSPEYSSDGCNQQTFNQETEGNVPIIDFKKTQKLLNQLNKSFNKKLKTKDFEKSVTNFSENLERVETHFKSLRALTSRLDLNLKPIELRLKQTIFEFIISLNITNDCFVSLIRLTNALKQNQFWPLGCMSSIIQFS